MEDMIIEGANKNRKYRLHDEIISKYNIYKEKRKFVRIGEGSIIYGIGHHRFIEMVRAAGATYM